MFDSHCHLTDPRFADDLDAVLERAWTAGLTGIVTIASDAADARHALQIVSTDPRIHATAGVHPHVAEQATDADLDSVRELVASGSAVAVGETGLDFHYDNSPRDVQRRLFDWHLRLAADKGLPVIVHCRSADDDAAAMIRGSGARGVLHCFAGGEALFDAAMEENWYISFAGMITFRTFDNHALLRAAPRDRLLVETDSPYLAPVPHRGRRNEPAFVIETARALASHRSEDFDDVAHYVTANALRFYRL